MCTNIYIHPPRWEEAMIKRITPHIPITIHSSHVEGQLPSRYENESTNYSKQLNFSGTPYKTKEKINKGKCKHNHSNKIVHSTQKLKKQNPPRQKTNSSKAPK